MYNRQLGEKDFKILSTYFQDIFQEFYIQDISTKFDFY